MLIDTLKLIDKDDRIAFTLNIITTSSTLHHIIFRCRHPLHFIRWPDGDREGWTQAASSKLAALLLYIQEKGYDVESHEVKLKLEDEIFTSVGIQVVTNFPRRVLHSLDSKATLKDLGLFPRWN